MKKWWQLNGIWKYRTGTPALKRQGMLVSTKTKLHPTLKYFPANYVNDRTTSAIMAWNRQQRDFPHFPEEVLWDFSSKGAQKNEFWFRATKVDKVIMLNNIDGSSRTQHETLIAKHDVGTKLSWDRDGDSRSCTLCSTRKNNNGDQVMCQFKTKDGNFSMWLIITLNCLMNKTCLRH